MTLSHLHGAAQLFNQTVIGALFRTKSGGGGGWGGDLTEDPLRLSSHCFR